ncbi:T9SS type A sorting domain-containing protein [Dyadobacter arcticus]|uniref:Por secretion system C-terminal sorting domain-containing protein n=1 Tax=Dyadobacter arcticus TaxID=1078754 RepID=A0ABX0UIK4_9BACT|nr:T9SS type A sorting domain-containing protein [Dyadobacter arcticus]NIJ52766.1 hypothetical protein [Dyadobacter arcticus]
MKNFFRIIIVVAMTFLAATLTSKAEIALEGYPNEQHIANGRYLSYFLPGGGIEYRANRSDATYSAQVIRYNLATGRWGLYLTRRSGGAPELVAWSDVTSSISVIASGWRTVPGSGTVYVTWPLKVYNTIEQNTSCYSGCVWSNPRTWTSGIVPRAYDNVTIDGNILLDVPGKCHSLTVRTGTSSSPTRSLVGRVHETKLKLYGNLFKGNGTLLDLHELEFAGNAVQSIETNDRYKITYAARIRINNPAGIQLRSEFGFMKYGTVRSELIFIKGKIYLGNYDFLCENIVDADETRFFVTNGTGMLKFFPRWAGEAMLRRFPVGPSDDRYTPMMVLFASANRDFSGMRAKASYSPAIFTPENHVNILYTVDHGTALPPSGTPLTWVYQFQWDAADATSSMVAGDPVTVRRWNGSSWSGSVASGIATGSDPFKYLFSTRSIGVNNFGLITETKRVVGTRLSAEESEMNAPEPKMEFTTFPNPAPSGGFNVNVADPSAAKLQLQSLSGLGIPFNSQRNSDNSIAIQPSQNLTPGMYLLQVRENDKTRVHKVLVK